MARAKEIRKPANQQAAAENSPVAPEESKARTTTSRSKSRGPKSASVSVENMNASMSASKSKSPSKQQQVVQKSGASQPRSKSRTQKAQPSASPSNVKAAKPATKTTTKTTQASTKSVQKEASKPKTTKAAAKKNTNSARRSQSVAPSASKQSEITIYKENTFVCFVNGSDESDDQKWDQFCLGLLDKNMQEGESRAHIHRFYQQDGKVGRGPVKFEREEDCADESVAILDFQIIAEIPAGDLTYDEDARTVSLKKPSFTKFNRLFKNALDDVMEKLGNNDDNESEEDDGEENSDEEDSDEKMDAEEQKVPAKSQPARTILRPKRKAPAATSKVKKEETKQTGSKKQPAARSRSKQAKKSNEDQVDDVDDLIKTDLAQPMSQPEIGKKRKHPASGPFKDDLIPQKRVKRNADGSEKVSETIQAKPKKVVKKPIVFKLGKWNPDTELVHEEVEKSGKSKVPDYSCCKLCNMRNLHRAVDNNDKNLLAMLVKDKANIPDANHWWSDDDRRTILDKIIEKNSTELLNVLFPTNCWVGKKQLGQSVNDQVSMHSFYNQERAKIPPFLLNKIDTGKVGKKAYGVNIRKVNMTRGNRQGNMAFDQETAVLFPTPMIQWRLNFQALQQLRTLEFDFFKKYTLVNSAYQDYVEQDFAYTAALSGNYKLVGSLIEPKVKHENFGFNKLHLDVLKLDRLTEKYATVSITKKCHTCHNATPLHFAAINPNEKVIEKLLEQNQDVNNQDMDLNKPIHFAAACQSTGPLEVLLAKGANLFDVNNKKQSPLHFAAMNGRADNIKLILETQRMVWKLRDKTNQSGFGYACQLGEIEPIKEFLDSGVVKINGGQGPDRMPPLSWAAAYGRYELCEWLLERKARVLSKDKYKRTPLMMAVKNGHLRVASLLLQNGSAWNHVDSSQNSVLHYAAAFGWKECIDLLLKHGADINAANMWKVTPITIAMLKNHQGIVKELLKRDDIDVNGKDEKGRTLLTMALCDLTDPSVLDFIKFLIEKGADPTISDVDGNTCMHKLACYNKNRTFKHHEQNHKEKRRIETQTMVKVTEYLIEKGAPLNLMNDEKETPFSIALDDENIRILDILADQIKISENPKLLHEFKTKIYDDRYKTVLQKLLNKEDSTALSSEVMNNLDSQGFTPFLAFVNEFVQMRSELMEKIKREISYQQFVHKERTDLYIVNNIDLFSKRTETDQAYQVHQRVAQNELHLDPVQKQVLEFRFFHTLIAQQFVNFLQVLVEKGADPHAIVEKLEFYRKLEVHKRHLQIVGEQRAVQDAVMNDGQPEQVQVEGAITGAFAQVTSMIDTTVTNLQNASRVPVKKHVKTRKEVLTEQKLERKARKGKKGKTSKSQNNENSRDADPNDPKTLIKQQVKDFYAKQGFSPQFETINGQKVEREYSLEYGQQTAIHLIMRHSSLWTVQYFLNELNIEFNAPDYQDRTPFSIGIDAQISRGEKQIDSCLKLLMESGAYIDYPDKSNQTPFLKLYNARFNETAEVLRERGININQMSKAGVFALKIALIRRDDAEIKRLASLGADINLIDQQGRNLLHHAINQSSSTADATFEIEQLLIDLGVSVNVQDIRGRVPLHYAFVKMHDHTKQTQIDPIETVSSLCAIKDLQIEVPDKWLKTPLHYAAKRSATISSLYIIQRGAELESKDIYGNTPLVVALQANHFNYGIILIQKQADVKVPVYNEFPKRVAKMWKDEEELAQKEARKANGDVDMQDDDEGDENKDKHRNMFNNPTKNIFFGQDSDDSDYSDSDDDTKSDDGAQMEINLMTTQNYYSNVRVPGFNNFGRQHLQPRAKAVWRGAQLGFGFPAQHQQEAINGDQNEVEPEIAPQSTFRVAIKAAQQGIAYLILDNGFDYMNAMQDALDEHKFQLFLTLIQKTADDSIVQKMNEKGQNLMHILAINSMQSGNQKIIITRIFNTLKQRGVNCLTSDNSGNNALHYAVKCNAIDVVILLLENGISVNQLNEDGHTPLSLALSKNPPQVLSVIDFSSKYIWNELLEHGADPNIVYPEESHKAQRHGLNIPMPEIQWKNKKRASAASAGTEYEQGSYKCSIMINYTQHNNLKWQEMLITFSLLMKHGAKFDVADSNGMTLLEHAVIKNNENLVAFILSNKDNNGVEIDHRLPDGRTAVHLVVKPLGFGSFENLEILKMLHEHGFDLNIRDNEQKTPLDHAMEQDSKVMARHLKTLLGSQVDLGLNLRRNSTTPMLDWPEFTYDFSEDAQVFLEEAEQKRAQEVFEIKNELDYVPIDKEFESEKQYKVYYDENKKPWDAYMTKIDLKNGPYGDYVFYKMQMVYDSNRELYIVLTRYGSIGQYGMHQRTPFNDIDEAKKEFRTIFKQKSGNNEFDAPAEDFVPQKKKYVLTKVNYSNVKHQDYLAPFDYVNCAKPSGLIMPLEDMIEEISNVTMYQRAMRTMDIDEDKLPVSGLKREVILEAKSVLGEISEYIKQLDDLRKIGLRADYDTVMTVMSKLGDLSSKYYELIPKKVADDQIVKPMRSQNELAAEFLKMDKLTNVEFTSRLLLAALKRQYTMHPMQYIYNSMGVKINLLKEGDPECDLIRAYCMNTAKTADGIGSSIKKIRIFKIERKGEPEAFEKVAAAIGNRKLLFHGSGISNFLGLLAQGMKIAPPEAPTTGFMFGKGCYFADMFQKSLSYSAGYKSKLLLLCDVALGKQQNKYRAEYIEKLDSGFHSVKGCGANGPDFKNKSIVTPQGFQLPLGPAIKYDEPSKETIDRVNGSQPSQVGFGFGGSFRFGGQPQSFYTLNHNEYIVYNTEQIRQRYIIQVQTSDE